MTVILKTNATTLLHQFIDDCRLRGLSEESLRSYRSSVQIFIEFLDRDEVNVLQVDVTSLKQFLSYLKDERRVRQKTVENYFTAISSFYTYLVFEDRIEVNPVTSFRQRYLVRYKKEQQPAQRQLLSVEEVGRLVNSIMDPRDRAIVVMLAKTGVRRGELLRIDVDDINWEEYSILLKSTPKRSNRRVFFDDECSIVLKRWLSIREKLNPTTQAIFVSYETANRLSRNGAYQAVVKYARNLGFHIPDSPKLEDHFGPHNFRHWFTTWLLRNGMPREYVKELRGDTRKEAIDIYHHIDREVLRRTYLACIPKIGI